MQYPKLSPALILVFALPIAAQILPPSLGISGRVGRASVELQGLPGSWVAVPISDEPADSAASSLAQRCSVRNGELVIRELKTGETHTYPVAAGSARFAFDANGALSALLTRETREIYTASAGWAPVFTLPMTAESLDVTIGRTGFLNVLYRDQDGLHRTRVDRNTGRVLSDGTFEDRAGLALLSASGLPVFATDSGLIDVASMQRVEQGWMLLSTTHGLWLWQPGKQPQGVPTASGPAPVLQLWMPDGTRDVGETVILPSTPVGSVTQVEYVLANTASSDIYLSTFHLTTATPFKLVGSPHGSWLIPSGKLQGFFFAFSPLTVGAAVPSSLTVNYCYARDFDASINTCPSAQTLVRHIAITGAGLAAPVSGPWLTGISPESNMVGAPGFTMFVNGGGFSSGSTVRWNGTPLVTTFMSATQLSAAIPAGLLTASADVKVTVSNAPGGSANVTKAWTFSVYGSITPSLALFDQNDVPLNPSQLVSNMTIRARVKLDQASTTSLSGVLDVNFQPSVSSVDSDPSIALGSPGSDQQVGGVQQFTVLAGATAAKFGNADYVTLTTGTTAGTITLGLALQSALPVPPEVLVINAAPPVVLKSSLVFTAGSAILKIQGYDNTRSLSSMSFTFFTPSGSVVSPGAIKVDVTNDFAKYYKTNAQIGGTFLLTATFAVSGDIAQIASIMATVNSSAGTTTIKP